MAAVLLHLSDIHIRSKSDWIIDKSEKIASTTFSVLPDASVVFIVVSGDIAYGGTVDEYKAARDFLFGVRDFILAERNLPIHFVVAPGNHDCDFKLNNQARKLILAGARSDPSAIDESVIDAGCLVQAPFFDFVKELSSAGESRSGDKLWAVHRFTVENREIVFDAINVSWCSQLKEAPGTLVFPHERYSRHLDEIANLRVSVIHHPLNWFTQAVYHPFRQLLRSLANVIVSGHEHVGGVGEDINANSGHSAYIDGCVLQDEKNLSASSFNLAEFNLDDGTYRSVRYLWNDSEKHYSANVEGSWGDFRTLPKKSISRFPLVNAFQQLLTDPGASFKSNAGAEIKLADLYVFPDMQEPLEKAETKKIINTSVFKDLSRLEGGVILSGEEKVGATSLLFTLFSHFHDRGLLPLYLRGPDIKNGNEAQLATAIEKAIVEQYGQSQVEKFHQASASIKILFLDDFDEGSIRGSSQYSKILSGISTRFKYYLVVVSEIFETKVSVFAHGEENLAGLKEFKLLPFGYSLRSQLVKRWQERTANDGSIDDATLLARCDQAERLLDSVMARNIVPSLPLYLLTLLQSIDAGASGGFEDSGLGEYYDFLIKEGLKSGGVNKRDWGKVIEYCSHLAWEMHATEQKELSIDELREFNDRYSRDEVRVDLDGRLDELRRSRLLSISGDYVRFRYHYIYYFLKGRFLSSRLEKPDVAAHVKECCAHLYVRENANTVLFLAHHAFNDSTFLGHLVHAIGEPFAKTAPIEFKGKDTAAIAEFVRDLPALSYTGEEPEIVRDRAHRRKDELGEPFDGMVDVKNSGPELDFVSQLVALFKTVEILGQILKNQVANIGREQRVEFLQLILNGPLRAIRAYFELFMKDKEQAQRELAELLAQRKSIRSDKCDEVARQVLAQLIQFTSFGFIAKAVTSISSDDLVEDIDSAAKALDTPAARLIATGVRLDSPKGLPRTELRKLLAEVETDFVAMRAIQMMLLRRLYMFRTTEQDKQWLDSQKLLGIKMQHAIDFNTRGKKLLNY